MSTRTISRLRNTVCLKDRTVGTVAISGEVAVMSLGIG